MRKNKKPKLDAMPRDTLPWRLVALGPLVGDKDSPHRLKWKASFKEGFYPVYSKYQDAESFFTLVRPKMLNFLSLGSLWRNQQQSLSTGGFEPHTIQFNADSQKLIWRSPQENGSFIFDPEKEPSSIPYILTEDEEGNKFVIRCSEVLRSYYASCIPLMQHLFDFKGSFFDLEGLSNPNLFRKLSWRSSDTFSNGSRKKGRYRQACKKHRASACRTIFSQDA